MTYFKSVTTFLFTNICHRILCKNYLITCCNNTTLYHYIYINIHKISMSNYNNHKYHRKQQIEILNATLDDLCQQNDQNNDLNISSTQPMATKMHYILYYFAYFYNIMLVFQLCGCKKDRGFPQFFKQSKTKAKDVRNHQNTAIIVILIISTTSDQQFLFFYTS